MTHVLLTILSFMLLGCHGEYTTTKTDSATISALKLESGEHRTTDPKSDVLIRYYQNGLALHHKKSGEFAFCQVCFSDLGTLPEDELLPDATIAADLESGKIEVFDSQGNLVKAYLKSSEINGHLILGVGNAFGYYPRENSDFSYLQSSTGGGTPPVMAVSCQCVGLTSTPCGLNGSDLSGCDVGGENATSCGVTSSTSANVGMTIVGTGASGGGGNLQGCNISCAAGSYACCNY